MVVCFLHGELCVQNMSGAVRPEPSGSLSETSQQSGLNRFISFS